MNEVLSLGFAMPLSALPRDLLIYILRHAAKDEKDFSNSFVRASVCKDLAAAGEAWWSAYDSSTTAIVAADR